MCTLQESAAIRGQGRVLDIGCSNANRLPGRRRAAAAIPASSPVTRIIRAGRWQFMLADGSCYKPRQDQIMEWASDSGVLVGVMFPEGWQECDVRACVGGGAGCY